MDNFLNINMPVYCLSGRKNNELIYKDLSKMNVYKYHIILYIFLKI